jgi:hypothetical protein
MRKLATEKQKERKVSCRLQRGHSAHNIDGLLTGSPLSAGSDLTAFLAFSLAAISSLTLSAMASIFTL